MLLDLLRYIRMDNHDARGEGTIYDTGYMNTE